MLQLIGGIKGAFAAAGGAAVALVLFLAWNTVWDNPRRFAEGKDFGSAQERILWEEARRKALAQMAENKRLSQADIDDLETQLLDAQRRASEAEYRQELDREIKKLPNREETVLPKSAADVLNKIGRSHEK